MSVTGQGGSLILMPRHMVCVEELAARTRSARVANVALVSKGLRHNSATAYLEHRTLIIMRVWLGRVPASLAPGAASA
jgi:hypothetical protein